MFHLLFAASRLSHSTFFSNPTLSVFIFSSCCRNAQQPPFPWTSPTLTFKSLFLWLPSLLPLSLPLTSDCLLVGMQGPDPHCAFLPVSTLFFHLPLHLLPSLDLFFSPSSVSSSCRPSTLFYQNTAQSKKGEQRGTGPVGGVEMDGRKRG